MNSPPKNEPILVAEGGVNTPLVSDKDSITAWIELMEVVEALCPQWPERPPIIGTVFKL